MPNIIAVERGQYTAQIQELFWEYLQWGNAGLNQEFGISLDMPALLAGDMRDMDKYMPPRGRLLLALSDEKPAGTLCLTSMAPGIGEVRRMYVRPTARKQGLGSGLLNQLLQEACILGFEKLRLDSPLFMTDAHRLYYRLGFQEVPPYPGSEIPDEFQPHWIFMELEMRCDTGQPASFIKSAR
jgi:GNAT superfamily N-acetyltransferase